MDDHPPLPDDIRSVLTRFNQLTGTAGDSARLDWTEQTLSVVGQLGNDPEAYDEADREVILNDIIDSQIGNVIIDEYDLTVIERDITDEGFRYEFDVSEYIDERGFVLNIPFDDDLTQPSDDT